IESPVRPRGRRLRRMFSGSVVPRIVLIAGAVFFIAPLYWMVVSALKSPQEGARFPPTLIPEHFVWQNFFDAVTYIPFFTFALNWVIILVGIPIGAVVPNPLVTLFFPRIKGPGRDKLFYVSLATIFLPSRVTLVPLFDIFGKLPAFGTQGSKSWVNTFLP